MIRRVQTLVLGLVLVVAALTTGSQALYFLLYLVVLVVVGAWLATRFALRGLEAGYALDRVTAQVGEALAVSYTVRNRSLLPKLWLDVHNPAAPTIRIPGRALSLAPRAQRSWTVPVALIRRGHHRIDPLVVRTGDPFGLFESYATVGAGMTVVVTPRIEMLPSLKLPPAMVEGPMARPERAIQATPLVSSIRPYVTGDAFNRIHWRSSARQGELQVKEFDIQQTADVWLFMDLDRNAHVGLDDDATIETAVRVAASIGARGLASARAVGIEAAGTRRAVLPPDRGVRQRQKLFHLLAAVGPDGMVPLRELLVDGLSRLGRGMTAVVVTPSLDSSWVRPLAALRGRGVAVLVCLIDPIGHDSLTRITHGLPAVDPDTLGSWERDRRAIRHTLAEHDIDALVVGPGPLGGQLVTTGTTGARSRERVA